MWSLLDIWGTNVRGVYYVLLLRYVYEILIYTYVQGAKKVLDPQKSDCKQKMEHLIKIHW